MKKIKTIGMSNNNEIENRNNFYKLYKNSPLPENETLDNLGLYIKRQSLSRILFMHELYKKIIDVHGVIMEFGVRWGQNLALFESFRGMYEPYNFNRKIIGFDTFSGFPEIHKNDGEKVEVGDYNVSVNYEEYLEEVLKYHESESPLSHIKKYEIIKGDASSKINEYLDDNPETIIALAYFDFDIYLPTKKCLEAIKDRVTKGSIIAFDELNYHSFPGETIALKEVFGINNVKLRRSPLTPLISYFVVE